MDTASGSRSWGFSLTLFVAYLGIFHLWMAVQPSAQAAVVMSCLVWCAAMTWYWRHADANSYFSGVWDKYLHLVVIVDVLLEGLLPIAHDHLGFYLCAIAFAAVLAPVHAYGLNAATRDPVG